MVETIVLYEWSVIMARYGFYKYHKYIDDLSIST